jgi:peroxiredoxin
MRMQTSIRAESVLDGAAGPLPAGTLAPDFVLRSAPDQTVSLSMFRGRPVVLAFYPSDWGPVSADQLATYRRLLPEIERLGAALIGISVDSVWCHRAFAAHLRLQFPLLADLAPRGAVARTYGVYRERDGVSGHALFVVDRGGIIRWSYLSPIDVNPGADGILEALESLKAASGRH